MTKTEDCITFTVQDVAKALGVSEDTIYRRIEAGELDAVRVGRRVMPTRQGFASYVARALGEPYQREMDAKIAAQDAAEDRARGHAVARHRAECEDPKSNRNRQLAAAWGPHEPVTAEPGTQGTRRRVLGEPTVIRAVPSAGDFRPAPGVSVARDPQPSAPLVDVEVAA